MGKVTRRGGDCEITLPDRSRIFVPHDQTIDVADVVAASLIAEGGWDPADAATAAFVPPTPASIDQVFLVNGVLSRRLADGTYTPVGGTQQVFVQATAPTSPVDCLWVVTDANGTPTGDIQAQKGGAAWATADGSGIAKALLEAKGDLIVATADDQAARLARGSDGYVLTVDAATTLGVKWAPAVAGPVADASITVRKLSALARVPGGGLPSGAIAHNVPGRVGIQATQTLTSQTLYVAGALVLPGGVAVSSITFVSGSTAPVGLANQWFCLLDPTTRQVLAVTSDDGSTAWPINTAKTLSLTAVYTPASDQEVLVGLCVNAPTPPNIRGVGGAAPISGIASVTDATSSTAVTSPLAVGATAGAFTAIANRLYAYVS